MQHDGPDDLKGQVIAITGASAGVGRATALAAAARGASLLLMARSQAALEDVARQARALGVSVEVAPLEELDPFVGRAKRVAIFLSVFDVHINRSPCAGTIGRMSYIPGKFVNAELDKASEENERQHLVVMRSDGVVIGMTQIAGLVARASSIASSR